MAQDTENRIDGQIESASKPQRWNKRLIAIGGIGSSLLIGVPIIGYYIKGKTKSLLEFFRIFRENPVWTMGFLEILILITGILYIYTGSKNHKKTACAFAGRLHHTGRVADGHRIHCDSGTALNGHHRTTGKKSTDVL